MLIGPFLGRFLAEEVDSFAGCKSSLVSLGLMTSMSSAIFSRVSSVEQNYWNLSEESLGTCSILTSCRKTVPHHRL